MAVAKGDDLLSELKQLRIAKKMTQEKACEVLGISLRSYKDYENLESKLHTPKYRYLVEQLEKYVELDED